MSSHYFIDFLIALFSLIIISAVFGVYKKHTGSKNVLVHALSFVPITCSAMTIACIPLAMISIAFITAVAKIFNVDSENQLFLLFNFLCILAIPIIVFVSGVLILRAFARKNRRKHIYTAYAIVFISSGILGFSLSTKSIFFPPWLKVQVENYFSYETQRMPNLSNEHNLRLRFNSGKIINLISFTYDRRDFTLYKLDDCDIFMKSEAPHRACSYIVSAEKEEVYYYEKGYKYELKGDAIYSLLGHGNAKCDIDKGTIIFFTYENRLNNNLSEFSVKGIEIGEIEKEYLQTLPYLGKLRRESFRGQIAD